MTSVCCSVSYVFLKRVCQFTNARNGFIEMKLLEIFGHRINRFVREFLQCGFLWRKSHFFTRYPPPVTRHFTHQPIQPLHIPPRAIDS